ncbi:hypothetical protein R3P38DRAFT_3212305 [Favolaschia claudopus]|uniref:Uncharacterized protein n=1 Tax=Favolaschia claudopus TaxID=2862362 RepID=A0AAW0AEJ0_9AGAR
MPGLPLTVSGPLGDAAQTPPVLEVRRGGEENHPKPKPAWRGGREEEGITPEGPNVGGEKAPRIKVLGGNDWERCVRDFVTLERCAGFVSKRGVVVPQGGSDSRPEEVPTWMNRARKWEKTVSLTSVASPLTDKGSFAHRWHIWWAHGQPESRKEADGSLGAIEGVPIEEWENFAKMMGKNGLLLYLGGLLWWGEAICEDGEESETFQREWKAAVGDAANALAMAVKAVKR